MGPDGEFGDAKHVGLSYTAETTLGKGGDLKWMKDGEDEVSVTLTNTSYSYIKGLEIVKYKEDMGGKITVLDTKTVKSSLTETSASFKLTDELVNEFSDSGFITYEKNGERGLKGKIGVRAVLAPYDFDFEISKDDYRGEVKVILINHGDNDFEITAGMRIAQLVISSVINASFVEVSSLDRSDRGEGGFGSSGTN